MALKDWKLELNEPNNKAWYNFKKNSVVRMEKAIGGYTLSMSREGSLVNTEAYTTKTKAMSSARNWMRSH